MGIKIRTIIEVAGFPQDHVNEVILKVMENLRKELKIKILKEAIAEAQPAKEVFSGFMELEIYIETFDRLIYFCQTYLPSSIEVLDTTEVKLTTEEFRNGMNDLIAYMHRLNLVVSNMQAQLQQTKQQ